MAPVNRISRAVSAAALVCLSLGACGKHPLPEHTSEPRSHTYVFGDRVGFGYGGDAARFQRYGWVRAEPHSTRTRPRGAALHFNVVDTDRPLTLRMKLSRVHEEESPPVQPVEVAVNGQKLTQWEVSRRGYYTCVIPAEFVSVDPVVGPAAFVVVDLHTPIAEPLPLADPERTVTRHGIRAWEMFLVEGAETPAQAASAPEPVHDSTYRIGRMVSFDLLGTGSRYNHGGWDHSEGIFSWVAPETPAALQFRVAPAGRPLSLKMRAAVLTSGPRLQVQPVEVRVNGNKLADWTIREPLQWFTAQVPAEITNASGLLTVELVVPHAVREAAARLPRQLRPLGVQLHDLLITDE